MGEMLRSLLQSWLGSTVRSRLREAVAEATRRPADAPNPPTPAEPPKPCHLGFVFALGIESGCLEDLLQGQITIRANGFTIREGGLNGRRMAIILAGAGQQAARLATEMLIDGHRPQRVISAGFAGGLSPQLRRNDILLADQVLAANGDSFEIEPWSASLPPAGEKYALHRGRLLTLDQVVRLPSDRADYFARFGAAAVDMETLAVAQVCLARQVPFSSVRVINDLSEETLPPDIENLLAQKSGAAQLGAALGAVWRRPSSAKDMYQLRENALVASGQLARFLADCT